MENFRREMACIKHQLEVLEVKNTKAKIKNKIDWLNSRLDMVEKKISKEEDMWIQDIQYEEEMQ